ncbi:hypothetical protein F5Y15DRAFT_394546 [Xylariaceae sp. FL0016]|nr:hypothetical protein F5Y15DRAFT_394546 [Xylariaceae sp. FL0016]
MDYKNEGTELNAPVHSKQTESKGKAKAKMTDWSDSMPSAVQNDLNLESRESDTNQSSVLSRLASSTASLSSVLIPRKPEAADLSGFMPSNKAGASGVAQGSRSAAATSQEFPLPKSVAAQRNLDGSFRSAETQAHVALEEARFSSFLDNASAPEKQDQVLRDTLFNGGPDSTQRQPELGRQDSSPVGSSRYDGLEVVELLNSGYHPAEITDDEPSISIEERSALQRAMLSGRRGREKEWDTALNFFPEYISNGSSGWGYGEMLGHLGISDVDEAQKIWVDDWQEVLSSYTDIVWGDLGSLVEEAKQELQQLADKGAGSSAGQLKAVRRLQQILGHVRGY